MPYTLRDKERILQALQHLLAVEAASVADAQRTTQAGATHPESRPENDKDTRALEATYLARGLATRADRLQLDTAALASLRLRAFTPDDPVALTALVTLQGDDDEALHLYFLAPAGGGARLPLLSGKDAREGTREVAVVTPHSPIGQALLGKRVDEEVRVKTPQGFKLFSVVDLC